MIAKEPLIRALAPYSFVAQAVGPDLYLVRKSQISGLYELVEFEVAGRRSEAVVVGLAIAVGAKVETQFKGLRESGGLPEVCTDPENGRVEPRSLKEAESWATHVGRIAPDRVSALAEERGPLILERTAVARNVADHAFRTVIAPASDLPAILHGVSSEQRTLVDNALSRPFTVPSNELQPAALAAVAALVRIGDPDVLGLGETKTSPSRDARVRHSS